MLQYGRGSILCQLCALNIAPSLNRNYNFSSFPQLTIAVNFILMWTSQATYGWLCVLPAVAWQSSLNYEWLGLGKNVNSPIQFHFNDTLLLWVWLYIDLHWSVWLVNSVMYNF